ncbi:hypothetical protein LOZ80_30155 [Paenibacillus sp. HWE-109]|uniref:hypothetical protein n=1 Tax=Paenibacillus sp. HWE-109 TaxID=1306526 RepID=UPI001EE0D5BD|nr:hypothetical protein [Paenibacillus sp. HWE-109]UKS25784.1 hypothetical protein LOZ80_30155 [Paenibacillus sp. HWE-109]
MSKLHSLSEELNQYTQRLQYPEHLDSKIEKLYRAHMSKKPLSLAIKRRKFARPALIMAACLILFSGIAYASTFLYALDTKQVHVEVTKDGAFSLPDDVRKELGESFKSIRNQLEPGESAVVYSAELKNRKLPDLLIITNPKSYSNLEQWKAEVDPYNKGLKLPESLPDGFTFVKGELQSPFGGIDESIYKQYHSLLQIQAKVAGTSTSWQKYNSSEGPFSNMTGLIFQNRQHEEIVVRYHPIDPSVKDVMINVKTNGSALAENVTLNGKNGYYSEMNGFMFSETGVSKSIQWMEEYNGLTNLYSVETPSTSISKEELLIFSNTLK